MKIDTNFYKENGYVLLKSFFDPREVDALKKDAMQVFARQLLETGLIATPDPSEEIFETAMVEFFRKDFDRFANCGKQCQHLIRLHRMSLSEKLVDALKRLGFATPVISTRPVLYFNKSTLAKSEEFYKTPPHQDWRSMQGSLNAIVVWLPMIDISVELGALKIIPGSHKWGMMDTTQNAWFRQINGIDDTHFRSVEVERGDALFFSSFLVHGSGDNVTDRIRWSCHFRYNDLEEAHFIKRGYPHPYIYKPIQEIITPGFPTVEQLQQSFS